MGNIKFPLCILGEILCGDIKFSPCNTHTHTHTHSHSHSLTHTHTHTHTHALTHTHTLTYTHTHTHTHTQSLKVTYEGILHELKKVHEVYLHRRGGTDFSWERRLTELVSHVMEFVAAKRDMTDLYLRVVWKLGVKSWFCSVEGVINMESEGGY